MQIKYKLMFEKFLAYKVDNYEHFICYFMSLENNKYSKVKNSHLQ